MAVIRQSAPALAVTITPDAGLEAQSITIFGWPALALAMGPPGSMETAGSEQVAAIVRQSAPALALPVGGLGRLLTGGVPSAAAIIRQSAPAFALVLGGAGTLLAQGTPKARAVIRQSAPALALALPGRAGSLDVLTPPPLDIRIVIGRPRSRWAAGQVWT
ncbi:hypothetical protein Ssi03_50680 [Sphaerisporangium siamense]|uniref:Uncharacterized protein n=1 Tax=Sphaerisporangium siamense TaxID=795645 RepID=A0A7W7DBA9_9ACTN|nr:hypothetical protein [Sphaerisporangium siamense]MBB4702228.1 hypothetical protein [Sphaerisporangium siamense]GII87078.1 hypothetical protein Ssi03_50680 [Sphaerisporangium siamense]